MIIDDAKDACRNSGSGFTCAVLCSGGCVCTLASIRTGFEIIWGTEICPKHQSHVTEQGKDLKCSCNRNTQQREDDETGWMFVQQTKIVVTRWLQQGFPQSEHHPTRLAQHTNLKVSLMTNEFGWLMCVIII